MEWAILIEKVRPKLPILSNWYSENMKRFGMKPRELSVAVSGNNLILSATGAGLIDFERRILLPNVADEKEALNFLAGKIVELNHEQNGSRLSEAMLQEARATCIRSGMVYE